ncbi:hypothetical protein [Hymenobacter busanensis]|uniref:hypothetical protein n=1 Tax=Hymenobacter busanensis TaxID=2607656 RepID=UPI0013675AB5|nr:hypothetical protein [Hymenobacter busanensis]QHJ07829.1 hypothetical protein GUY19_11285 [Hymenobacter busanensis]
MPPEPSSSADDALRALRPSVPVEPTAVAGTADAFLHHTLRPVLKLLNAHLLQLVADVSREYRLPLATAAAADQERLVLELLQRNARLQHTVVGMVCGLLTTDEYAFYRRHRAECNRRVLELVRQRVSTQLPTVATLATSPDAA